MIAGLDRKKYRQESFRFKTDKGYAQKPVVITAGDNERARLLEKAERMAKDNNWKLV